MDNRCVCCGAEVPEGRQVCPTCEVKNDVIVARCSICGAIVKPGIEICPMCIAGIQEAIRDV